MHGPFPQSPQNEGPKNEDLALSSLLSSIKAHRRKHNKPTHHQSKPKYMQEGTMDLSKFKAHQRWLLT